MGIVRDVLFLSRLAEYSIGAPNDAISQSQDAMRKLRDPKS
jgi:hypothetical protein